jgi:hypothetical protein
VIAVPLEGLATPVPEPIDKTVPSPGADRIIVIDRVPAVDLVGLSPSPLAYTPISPPAGPAALPPPARPVTTLGSLKPPPVAEPEPQKPSVATASAVVEARPASAREAAPPSAVAAPAEPVEPEKPSRLRMPSSYYAPETAAPAPRKERSHVAMWIVLAVAGTVFAIGARIARERETAPSAPLAPAEAPAPAAAALPEAAGVKADSVARDRREGESSDYPIAQDLPLRSGDKVAPGQGLLEVSAGSRDTIYIDGRLAGNGPVVKMPLEPRGEPYEIRVKLRGEERVRFVLVKEGRLTRLRVAPPWSR